MSDFLRSILPPDLNLEDGPAGDPRPDLPVWAQGTPFDPSEGLDDVKARAAINPITYLNWRTLPDGTRTHRLDFAGGKQAWLDFFSALPWQGPEDAVRRGLWSRAELAAAEQMAAQAQRDRLLMAAAEVAHDNGTPLTEFLDAASKVFAFTERDSPKCDTADEPDPTHDQ